MPTRTLMIGLDGADPGLLDRWCATGALPVISGLRSGGAAGRLSTPPGLGDDAVWPSFYTGTPVGTHGRYFWKQLDGDAGRVTVTRDRLPVVPPFWQALSTAGQRIAVVDVPKCPVSSALNGIQLRDWLVHGRDHPHPVSCPASLAAEIVAEFGEAPCSLCSEVAGPLDDQTIRGITTGLTKSADMKLRASHRYLAAESWDLFIAVFKETHCASHLLWHLVDPRHPEHDPGLDRRLDQPVRAIYGAVDAAAGALIAAAGADASVVLFTTLGMAPNYTGRHLMDEIAARINARHGKNVPGLRQVIATLFDRPRRGELCRVLPHNEASGALRLAVAGRDLGGQIQPGGEYDALCNKIADDLRGLTDRTTGAKIVDEVVKSAESFPGPAVDGLPDLFVVWKREFPIGAAWSERLGLVEVEESPGKRSGNHVPGGAYVVTGPASRRWPANRDLDMCDLSRVFLEASNLAKPRRGVSY